MARNDFRIDIDWEGFDEFREMIGDIGKTYERDIIREMNNFKSIPEEGTKALTPVDENDLTKSITSTPVMRTSGEYFFTIGSNLPYALAMHEHNQGWGVKTRNKQKALWRGYTPGRKYLENAVEGSEESFDKMNERLLDKMTGGRG